MSGSVGGSSALEAVQRLKDGADAVLRSALASRERAGPIPQAEQERLAAAALSAAQEVDDALERAKLACAAETEDDVLTEVLLECRAHSTTLRLRLAAALAIPR